MAYWKIKYIPNIDKENPRVAYLNGQIVALSKIISQIPLAPDIAEELNALKIKREVLGTTGIEGNCISEENIENMQLNLDEVVAKGAGKEQQEIINSFKCFQYIIGTAKVQYHGEITEELIKKLHQINTQNINYGKSRPGEYRTHNVKVGKNYECEKFEEIPQQMKNFVHFINSPEVLELSPAVRAILAHFYLVSIHPFGDGNGRTSRAVEAYVLACANENTTGFYSLANFYYKNREEYFLQLDQARFKYKGDLNAFVLFALNGLVTEIYSISEEVISFSKKLAFDNYARELYAKKKVSKRSMAILELIKMLNQCSIGNILTPQNELISSLFGNVSERTIRRDIQKLLDHELIERKGDILTPNYNVMNRFTPQNEVLANMEKKMNNL